MPVAFQAAALLAAGAHPSHLLNVSSWGFTPLPPSCNLKFLGYSVIDDYFIELDFQLDIHGGHAAAGQYLAVIDKCQRLLVVSDLTLQ